MRRLVVALTAVLTAVVLTGCGSSGSKADPMQAMRAAKAALDGTAGVHVTITSANVPSGQNGLTSAEGFLTRNPPAFKGTGMGSFQGFSASVSATAIGGKIYAKMPVVGVQTFSPSDLGFPDPAQLLNPTTGISSLLLKTKSLASSGQTRTGANNDVIVSTYTGTLSSEDLSKVLPVKSGTFQVTYQIGSDGKLVGATVTGPFYAGATSTYTLSLDQYGIAPTITAP